MRDSSENNEGDGLHIHCKHCMRWKFNEPLPIFCHAALPEGTRRSAMRSMLGNQSGLIHLHQLMSISHLLTFDRLHDNEVKDSEAQPSPVILCKLAHWKQAWAEWQRRYSFNQI